MFSKGGIDDIIIGAFLIILDNIVHRNFYGRLIMKVSFLFGAGCEDGGQLNLPAGDGFKRDTILAKDAVEFFLKLNKPTNSVKIRRGCFLTANSSNVLYQTIKEQGVKTFSFDTKSLLTVKQYLAAKDEGKDLFGKVLSQTDKDAIKESFRDLYRTQFYDEIVNGKPTLSGNAVIFLKKACFNETVDSLFNYLRKPEKYPVEIGRVIKLYYSAFLSVVRSIIEDAEYDSFLNTSMEIGDARKSLESLLKKNMTRISAEKANETNLYYNLIHSFIDQSDSEVSVVTANYTEFAQTMIGLSSDKIAYVHGKLDLFEDVLSKKVDSILGFADDEVIFPHIFVQSGIKPIVSSNQISELYKAKESLLKSDVLVILGYGVNSDDEHLSNLLRERLRKGQKIDYFLHGKDNSTTEKQRIKNELFDGNSDIVFHDTKDFEIFLNGLK